MICTITSCRGDSQALQSGNLVATLWLDSKVVTTMSTNCQPKEMGTVKRRQRDGSRIEVACPSAVVLYNRYMGGVDRNDQIRQYYHVRSRGRKYYRYIFWFLFETCVANAGNHTQSCNYQMFPRRRSRTSGSLGPSSAVLDRILWWRGSSTRSEV